MKKKQLNEPVTKKLPLVLALAISTVGPGFAVAQQDEPVIEELLVVGSQIRGARITGALPVSVVGSEQIANTAAVSGDDLFRSIPEAGDITFNGTYLGGGNSNAARGCSGQLIPDEVLG